jgi:hypothetical protein
VRTATLRSWARDCELAPLAVLDRGEEDLGGDVRGVAAAAAVARVTLAAVFGAVGWGCSPRSIMVVVTR